MRRANEEIISRDDDAWFDRKMIGILLVTHGGLAEELKAAALTIQPEIEQIVAVSLEWNQVGDEASRRIAKGLKDADSGEGAVILTDMFGGTPTNLTLPFLKRDRVEIVTGVNLPMVLKCAALQKSGKPVVEIAHLADEVVSAAAAEDREVR